MTHLEAKSESGTGKEPASLIAGIAEREGVLMERLAEAERDAKGIIERARTQAEVLAEEESKRLAQDVRAVRQAAAEARARTELELRAAAGEEFARIRARTKARTHEIVEAIERMILPRNEKGGAS